MANSRNQDLSRKAKYVERSALTLPKVIDAAKRIVGKDPSLDSRKLNKKIKSSATASKWLSAYVEGDDPKSKSRISRSVNLIRKTASGEIDTDTAIEKLIKISESSYRERLLHKEQGPLRAVVPDQIRQFLPRNIIIRVDPDGRVREITDRFANERDTLDKKIKTMKRLVSRLPRIMSVVEKDLRSNDERTQMLAIITSIIMETGIRPGSEGSAAETEFGTIPTYGAITLRPEHIYRSDRTPGLRLEFVGKKGTVNKAAINDPLISSVVMSLSEESGPGEAIFTPSDGVPISYPELLSYFKRNFPGLTPTDFRKLAATKVVFDGLQGESEDLKRRIRAEAAAGADDLRNRVADEIAAALSRAVESAQGKLSHLSHMTTKESYINPEIIIDLLSRGDVAPTLEDAILDNDKFLVFDLEKFTASPLTPNPPHLLAMRGILMAMSD